MAYLSNYLRLCRLFVIEQSLFYFKNDSYKSIAKVQKKQPLKKSCFSFDSVFPHKGKYDSLQFACLIALLLNQTIFLLSQ
jgi:hypothetical protein